MAPSEPNDHVFIVRLWREPREIEGAEPLWRGVIEEVRSGQRRYFDELEEIVGFIARCLGQAPPAASSPAGQGS
ncbi:MAG: hypothetical protein Kow0092_36230 [Deferrisomatales bacterium]